MLRACTAEGCPATSRLILPCLPALHQDTGLTPQDKQLVKEQQQQHAQGAGGDAEEGADAASPGNDMGVDDEHNYAEMAAHA